MKKVLVLLFSVLIAINAVAERISAEKARENVAGLLNRGSSAQRRVAAKITGFKLVKESEGYYIFTGKNNTGYVIAAADDQMREPVLGFSDSGDFLAEEMPENMKWWLEQYDEEAKMLASATGLPTLRKAPAAEIAPMLKSLWNQGAPYNAQCPIVSGNRAPTGCVATAMAQIMYYHKWPNTYNWSAMKDTYNDNDVDNELARMNHDVGVAVQMTYGASASGAHSENVPTALSNTFGYSKEAYYYERTYYSSDEWEDMIYESLSKKEPIYYSGSGSGGHAFVCDGYKDGYYHFNWGWGGVSNGYFLLTALNPNSQGWGGSMNGYNGGQGIVLNIRPDKEGNTVASALMSVGPSADFMLTLDQGYYQTNCGFFNYSGETHTFDFGLEFVDENGNSEFKFANAAVEVPNYYGYSTYYFPSSLLPKTAGTYKVYPAYKDISASNKPHRMLFPKTYCNYCILTYASHMYKISSPETAKADLRVADISHSTFYKGKYATVTTTFRNVGQSNYNDDVVVCLVKGNTIMASTMSFVDLDPNESHEITLKLEVPADADETYNLYVLDTNYNAIYASEANFADVPSGLFAGTFTSNPKLAVDENLNVTIETNISCTSGYEDEFIAFFYDGTTGNMVGYMQSGDAVGKGEKATVKFYGQPEWMKHNTQYIINFYAYMNSNYYQLQYGTTVNYTLTTPKENTTAINDIEVTLPAKNSDKIYNLNGQRVNGTQTNRIYIQNGKKILK